METARESLEIYRSLVKSEGWKSVMAIAEEQIRLREANLTINPIKSVDDAFDRNLQLGERSGIKLFMTIPDTILENLQEFLEEHREVE